MNATIICEARELLFLQFDVTDIMYRPRECNSVAHELAKFGAALGTSQSAVWLEEFPQFVTR